MASSRLSVKSSRIAYLLAVITVNIPSMLVAQQVQVANQSAVQTWTLASDSAAWRPRDSSGEVVFKNQLWIMGGWFDSFQAPPRDVWSSKDGVNWSLVNAEAPWIHSDFPMTVTYHNRMWLMGGWYLGRLDGHSASNQVWSSKNGRKWKQHTGSAAWSPRIGSGLVVFKDKMWLLGGTENYYFGDSTSLKNDVWSSRDGVEWTLETNDAGWAPRAFHTAVVFDDKIFVIAGGNYTPKYKAYNDVWQSEDGVHWKQVTENAPWSPRIWFSSVVYRDHMWVIGGWSSPSRNWNDVWYSADGSTWHQLTTATVWSRRHEHSTYVFDDKIWVAGGYAAPLTNDIWTLQLPADWTGK